MNRPLSIYLDLLRFTAAIVVFLGHTGTMRISGGLGYQFTGYGQIAVDVFFAMSGFVIGYAADTRERNAASYAVNRAARVFSVAIPALAFGMVLDRIGHAAQPELYQKIATFSTQGMPGQLAVNLLFLGQVWFNAIMPGSNLPYWSLGYEVWYYAIFGMAAYAAPAWRWPCVAMLLLLAGPKVALYFPLWLIGLAAYHICKRGPVGPLTGGLFAVLPVAALLLSHGAGQRGWWPYQAFVADWSVVSDLWRDYLAALLVAMNMIGVHALGARAPTMLDRIAPPIRWAAGATFTFYLFHMPLLNATVALMPWPHDSWQVRTILFLGIPPLLFLLAEVTERRRDAWRRLFAHAAPQGQTR